MARTAIEPTGIECPFDERELIITKTDLKGRITYANDVFLRISKYSKQQVIGAPHSLIRHPDMPRCIFKLLWDTVRSKKGLFAHILNMASNGDHYWTFAHVTATLDAQQNIMGFHSNRRKPNPAEVGKAKVLYAALRAEENLHDNSKEGMLRSCNLLMANLKDKNRPEAQQLASGSTKINNSVEIEFDAAIEAVKNLSLTGVAQLKGNRDILKKIDDAEIHLQSLRRTLSS